MFKHLNKDIPASIVVFLVALPLCLGIALASGAPLFSGLIAGIVGGIVIGIISDSQLSVSGPAAGLAAVVLAGITKLGAFETFLLAVVIAGLLQVLFGVLKGGTFSNYIPSAVIKGMLTAIGIIIIMKQIPHAFGYDKEAEGDFSFLNIDGENTFTRLLHPIEHIDIGATIIALVALAILIVWDKPFMKAVKAIPAGLVAVLSGVAINEFLKMSGSPYALGTEHLVNIPVATSFQEFLGQFTLPDYSQITNKNVWIQGFVIAAVASIETMLCVEAIDKLDPDKRSTNGNRELIAQGIGNTVSGLLGGLPITSVIVRSSANLNAGAKTKTSAILHGVFILLSVALIPMLLNKIPLAALAAILLMTGYKLCKIDVFKEILKLSKHQYIPFLVTVAAVVFTDLLTGVGIGIFVSVFWILRGNMKTPYFFKNVTAKGEKALHLAFSQEMSFLNKASVKNMLNEIPENTNVILDATKTKYIDYDVLEAIKEYKDIKAPLKNIKVSMVGFREEYKIDNDFHLDEIVAR